MKTPIKLAVFGVGAALLLFALMWVDPLGAPGDSLTLTNEPTPPNPVIVSRESDRAERAEADDEVIDGPRSLVLAQAANRLHVQRALFLSVLGK